MTDKQRQAPQDMRSHWRRGCDDAKAGRKPEPPTNEGPFALANQGYYNGYRWGAAAIRQQQQEEGK